MPSFLTIYTLSPLSVLRDTDLHLMHIQRNEVKGEQNKTSTHTHTLIMLKYITHTQTQLKSWKKNLYNSKEEKTNAESLYWTMYWRGRNHDTFISSV